MHTNSSDIKGDCISAPIKSMNHTNQKNLFSVPSFVLIKLLTL